MSVRITRQFSVINLVGMITIAVLLGFLYRSIATSQLKHQVSHINRHLTQLIEYNVIEKIQKTIDIKQAFYLQNLNQNKSLFKKLDLYIRGIASGGNIIKVKMFDLAGFAVYSTQQGDTGKKASHFDQFLLAKNGTPASDISFRKEMLAIDGKTRLTNLEVMSTYMPVHVEREGKNEVIGVFELYSDVTQSLTTIRRAEYIIYAAVFSLYFILFSILYSYVRKAEKVIEKETKEREVVHDENLFYATHYDDLTQLPNRNQFFKDLDKIVGNCARTPCAIAIMVINIDRMDWMNNYGVEFGNKVIEKTANFISLTLREGDKLYRIDGSEFGVILQCASRKYQAKLIADRIHDYFREPLAIENREVHIGLSIGIAVSPDDSSSKDELFAYAASAMCRAKDIGGNISMFYSHYINRLSMQRYELETELRKSLSKGQFEIYYQPKIDMQRLRVVGAEALIRWNHPDKGLIQPEGFIKSLESTGFIIPVGEWVLEQACQQCRHWHDIGFDELSVAVNISTKQFNSDLLLQTKTILYESGLAPQFLELEITESVLAENVARAIDILASMKQAGIKLSIDDFGTGYSSLSYLASFPVDNLKVDRSFVKDITINKRNASITETIIAMAKSLEMHVIVEGIETEEQFEYLRRMGCRIAQGFFFSQPISGEEFTHLLETGVFSNLKIKAG